MDEKRTGAESRLLSRPVTESLKGIAILLMLIHHFFTFPHLWPDPDFYSWTGNFLISLAAPTKICVGIFAFITGYAYHFTKKKDIRYSARKIGQLFVRHAAVAVPLIVSALILRKFSFDPLSILLELLGVHNQVMVFSWYVYFYFILMLFLPLITKIFKDHPWYLFVFVILILNLINGIIYGFIPNNMNTLRLVFSNCWIYTQPAVCGYLAAANGLPDKLSEACKKIPSFIKIILSLLLLTGILFLRKLYYFDILSIAKIGPCKIDILLNADILYVPLFIFCMGILLSEFTHDHIRKALELLGKYSVYMWFWHAMFFGCLSDITRKILYAPKHPVPVLVWGVAIVLALSYLTDKIISCVLRERASSSHTSHHPHGGNTHQA